jgi:alkylated DNA repair dioxygenase AlkB
MGDEHEDKAWSFGSIIEANYRDDDTLIIPGDSHEMWLTFIGALTTDEMFHTDTVLGAMRSVPVARDLGWTDRQSVGAWCRTSDPDDDKCWDVLLECSKAGVTALRHWLRDHRIPLLGMYVFMPECGFHWVEIPAFPEGFIPECTL